MSFSIHRIILDYDNIVKTSQSIIFNPNLKFLPYLSSTELHTSFGSSSIFINVVTLLKRFSLWYFRHILGIKEAENRESV